MHHTGKLISCTQVSEQPSSLPFNMFADLSSAKGMVDMIRKEMRKLRGAKVGGNEDFKPQGQFVLVGGVYIYHHWKSTHAACSRSDFGVIFEVKNGKMLNCGEDDHLLLEPYFKCNQYVLDAYQEKVGTASEEVKQGLMKDIELLTSKDPGETDCTPFKEPHEDVYDWDKNDWTYRLCYGMGRFFPKAKVHYTAEDGPRWGKKVLEKLRVESRWLNVSC